MGNAHRRARVEPRAATDARGRRSLRPDHVSAAPSRPQPDSNGYPLRVIATAPSCPRSACRWLSSSPKSTHCAPSLRRGCVLCDVSASDCSASTSSSVHAPSEHAAGQQGQRNPVPALEEIPCRTITSARRATHGRPLIQTAAVGLERSAAPASRRSIELPRRGRAESVGSIVAG